MRYEILYGTASVAAEFVGFILGLVAIFLASYLTLITATDIVYMTIPGVRQLLKKTIKNQQIAGLRIISQDAIKSMEEGYSTDRSPLIIYLKKRLITYIVAAVLLFLILTGNTVMKNMAFDTVIRILDALNAWSN